jgi:hypothetical protein
VNATLKNRDMQNNLLRTMGARPIETRGGGMPGYNKPSYPGFDEKGEDAVPPEDEKDMDTDKGEPDEWEPNVDLPDAPELPRSEPGDGLPPEGPMPGDMPPMDERPEKPEGELSEEAGGPLVFVVKCLARLENIEMTYKNTYGTDYEERSNAPTFPIRSVFHTSCQKTLFGEGQQRRHRGSTGLGHTGQPQYHLAIPLCHHPQVRPPPPPGPPRKCSPMCRQRSTALRIWCGCPTI